MSKKIWFKGYQTLFNSVIYLEKTKVKTPIIRFSDHIESLAKSGSNLVEIDIPAEIEEYVLGPGNFREAYYFIEPNKKNHYPKKYIRIGIEVEGISNIKIKTYFFGLIEFFSITIKTTFSKIHFPKKGYVNDNNFFNFVSVNMNHGRGLFLSLKKLYHHSIQLTNNIPHDKVPELSGIISVTYDCLKKVKPLFSRDSFKKFEMGDNSPILCFIKVSESEKLIRMPRWNREIIELIRDAKYPFHLRVVLTDKDEMIQILGKDKISEISKQDFPDMVLLEDNHPFNDSVIILTDEERIYKSVKSYLNNRLST
jgi:hypothetical protein